MSYLSAETILPNEIIEMIQQYVDGETIYIPRKNGSKKSWGEKNGTKDTLSKRNNEIYSKFCEGESIYLLSKRYFLSEKSIRRIIHHEKLSQ
ncbi:hypothetical protein EJF36_12780 [Bacillus sp. HMF5848]|uniref:CD3324 family protein n=1 Tax=Bacillus sp. HMF5848 TaxID=2495421 RepID=UPI000F79162F|nr:CD3324 family protein [Bacillus sp. HMF5848]RSK27677.1 hypothetical protein EJF36_12780 [Bacillus sp. HMF5848]